jgi:hypothetical protein
MVQNFRILQVRVHTRIVPEMLTFVNMSWASFLLSRKCLPEISLNLIISHHLTFLPIKIFRFFQFKDERLLPLLVRGPVLNPPWNLQRPLS